MGRRGEARYRVYAGYTCTPVRIRIRQFCRIRRILQNVWKIDISFLPSFSVKQCRFLQFSYVLCKTKTKNYHIIKYNAMQYFCIMYPNIMYAEFRIRVPVSGRFAVAVSYVSPTMIIYAPFQPGRRPPRQAPRRAPYPQSGSPCSPWRST